MIPGLEAFHDMPAIDGRPGAEPPRQHTPRPTQTISANELAYATREAVTQVLPASWHKLPNGNDTAAILAGTIANLYAKPDTTERETLG